MPFVSVAIVLNKTSGQGEVSDSTGGWMNVTISPCGFDLSMSSFVHECVCSCVGR